MEKEQYEDIDNYCSICGSRYKYGQMECAKCSTWFCDSCDDQRNGLEWDDKLCPNCIAEMEERGEITPSES